MTSTPTNRKTKKSLSPSLAAQSGKTLFIVESPTKVRTIEKFLGDEYIVAASIGHIADIPTRKGAVNVAADFAATYELTTKGREVIADLQQLMKGCSQVILATDDDREGELIAAHLLEFLNPPVPVKRVVFHAVTKEGIEEALRHPRDIDENLVEAARARRILDRLFGFEVSDVTRQKVRKGTTAGRVQSPALRMIVEREYDRMKFVSATYADVIAVSGTTPSFTSTLRKVGQDPIASGKDFNSLGQLVGTAVALSQKDAEVIATELRNGDSRLVVVDISEKPFTRQPRPPLTMSTLYQDAINRLGMSMKEAQSVSSILFDKGLITYPRTDNPVHDPASRRAIRQSIEEIFGSDLVAPYERYTTSKKKSQGAHEAIRPTNLAVQTPKGLTERQVAMYQLIWQRTMATQMVEARGMTKSVTMTSQGGSFSTEFTATGSVYQEMGFRKAYHSLSGDDESTALPDLAVGEIIDLASVEVRDHVTTPPPRFTEASLVKELEEVGIGRPSTYASIIAKLRERYVWSKSGDRALIPTVTAFAVHRLLTHSFAELIDDSFTSAMEHELDEIAEDKSLRRSLLEEFYFGTPSNKGLHALVTEAISSVTGKEMYALTFGIHPESGHEIILRAGRLFDKKVSPYIECGELTVSIPDQSEFSELSHEAVLRLLARSTPRLLGHLEGIPVFVRYSENGSFLQWGDKNNFPHDAKKPRSIGLLKSMNADTLTLDDAAILFALPRTVGATEEGEIITATLGKFGGYIICGTETRSLKDDSQIFSITEAEAIDLLKQPKKNRFGSQRKRKSSSSD